MASDLERLVVSLDADINKLQKQLSRAGIALDTFDKDVDSKTKRTAKKITDNIGSALNDNRALRPDQLQNLSFQLNDVFTSLASGAPALRVLAQQGGQVYQVLQTGQGGVTGSLKDLAGRAAALVTPATAAGAALLAIGAAGVYVAASWSEAQQKIRDGLRGIGGASGATVDDINRIATAAAQAGKITVGDAREAATAAAATGKIGVGNIPSVVDLVPGFAKITGQNVTDAGKELAKIFSDPTKGADELNARLGVLDDKTRQYILTLSAQGDRQGAIAALAKAAQPELAKAAEETGIWAKAWQEVANAASLASNATRAAFAPTDQERLSSLQAQRDALASGGDSSRAAALRSRGYSDARIAAIIPGYDPQRLDQIDSAIDKLKRKIDETNKAAADTAAAKAAAELSRQAGEVVRAYDAAGEEIRKVEDQLALLQRALDDPDVAKGIAGGVDRIMEAFNALRTVFGLLKQDYVQGGAAAAAALRQANFEQRVAGLNSYERGLQEIKFRFDEARRSAQELGNTKALPTINAQEVAALSAYAIQSRERAQQSVSLPNGLADTFINIESGNRNVAASGSSASGYAQFTEGTFLPIIKKIQGDLFAQLGSALTEESKRAILALRSDRTINVAATEEYARQNAVQLNAAGIAADLVNLYLAHFLGAGGAIKLLKADPSTNAASLLPEAAKANPGPFKNGSATAGDVVEFAQRRVAANNAVARSQQDATRAQIAENQSIDAGTVAAARLESIQTQLNADREAGGELGQRFATAQDLIKASSDGLTPALKAQRDEILRLADARAQAAGAGLSTRFQSDLAQGYGALGRTSDEQATFQQARGYGLVPGSDQFAAAADGLTRLREAASAKDATGGFLKGLTQDLINGTRFSVALTNQLKRLAASLADKAIDKLLSGLFGGLFGGGGGGLLGGGGGILSSAFGFASPSVRAAGGGYIAGAGSSTSDSILARLSNGEFVVNAAATSRYRPLLERLNGGAIPAFATGGPVGTIRAPVIPLAVAPSARQTGSPVSLTYNINAPGADAIGLAQLRQQLDDMRRTLPQQIAATNRNIQTRGLRP